MMNKPTYAYSTSRDNPSDCDILRSTSEVDGWEQVGTVDRDVAQLVVTSLNYAPDDSHRYCDENLRSALTSLDDVLSLLHAAMKIVDSNTDENSNSVKKMYKLLMENMGH